MRKIVLIVVAVIVLVIVAAPFLIPVVIDLNDYKSRIAEAVREATGRELVIGGEISYSLLPAIEVSLGDVRLSNAPGMPTPEMLSLGSFSARIALWPLLSREVVVESLVIEELSLFLEVAEDGRPNWAFDVAAAPEEAAPPPQINDIRLGDVRLERGFVSYIDSRSGQAIQARDINLTVTLADIASALNVNARMIVNDEPVTAEVHLDSPAQVLAGERFAVRAAIGSERISVGVEGKVQQAPVPGFDGTLSLDVESVGALMAWLQQPLDDSQPDPGPLKVRARLAADGARVALEQVTIEGTALQAKASGSFDGSGEIAVITLEIESGVLDIDRYLPPPAPATTQAAAGGASGGAPVNPLAMLSDKALDLSPLRQTRADVKVRIGGVKAAGFEVGRVALSATLKDGVLALDLTELGLYGGKVAGKVRLDGAGQALGVAVDLKVDKVDVGRLARAATGGEAPVAGVASGTLTATATGASPRALAEALKARLVVDLGGIDIKDAPAGAISALAVDLDLPGLETPMTLKGSVVYNKERVDLDLTLDPLKQVLSADRFGVSAVIKSRLLSAAYKGDVQLRPAPGLDGTLDLDVGSVGKLAAWLGQPLDAKQPDPGPLKVRASFAAEGERVALKEATIRGSGLEVQASGSFEKGTDVDKVVLNLRTGVLDIDRYLPPPVEAKAPAGVQAGPPADPLAALSDEPLDLSVLKRTEVEMRAAIGGIKAMGYQVGEVQFSARLKDGELVADLAKMVLYGGGVAGKVRLDTTGAVPRVALAFNVKGVDVGALARAAMGDEAPLAGIAEGSLSATTTGASPRALVEGLKGKLAFSLGGVEVKDAPGTITQIAVDLDLPGLDSPPSLKGSVTYNGEQVAVDLTLDPLKKVLRGERFAVKAALNSTLVSAAFEGSVQQRPTPGLDGVLNLDVGSVGRLAAWLGQPLDPAQPDPGPLKVQASFETQGAKATLKEATIQGKAVSASLQGSFDTAPEVPQLVATINIAELDLDAYLPPQRQAPAGQPAGAGAPSQGWSTEPFDLAPLRELNADLRIDTGPVKVRGLVIEKSRVTVTLKDAVLNATIEELLLAGGRVGASLALNAASDVAALSYQLSVDGVQARPLLIALADSGRLSGRMILATRGEARGRNLREVVSTLNGDGSIKFLDGAIEGMNLAAALRQAKTLGFDASAGQRQKTDFAELGGTFVIANGVIDNRDFQMLAPLVRVQGAGLVPMPPRTVDYRVEAKLVASLAGQGGENALAGLPIPVHITGSWDNPSYNVDWASVFRQAALDPERLANMPNDLKGLAEGFGIKLPIPALPGAGEAGAAGALGGLLGALPGVSGGDQGATSTGGLLGTVEQLLQPAPAAPAGTPQPAPAPLDPVKMLKGLFGGD